MLPHLLLLAALLAACSGPREDGPSETVQVQALAGDDILLPCSYRVLPSNELPTVEWSKKGLEPNVVLLYRDGCETPEMKNPAFWYRTSLVTKELTLGNISLRIGDVRLSDAGSYRCTRLWKDLSRDVTEVQLVVGGGFFSPNKGSSEGQSMLPSGPHAEDENERNAVVEAEVKQLRLTVAEQADTIRQLLHNNNNNNNNNGDDGARLAAVVCHIDRPACPESPAASPPADAPQALKRRHSSPPRLTPHAIAAAAVAVAAAAAAAAAAAPTLMRLRRLNGAGRERVQRRQSVASAALQRVAEESEVLLPREEPDGLVCDFTEMLSD